MILGMFVSSDAIEYFQAPLIIEGFESSSSTTSICESTIHIKISDINKTCSLDCNTSWGIGTIVQICSIFIFWNNAREIVISTIEFYKDELSTDIIKEMLIVSVGTWRKCCSSEKYVLWL